MARRRSGIEQLIELPWWLNLIVGGIVYGLLRFGLPNMAFENPAFSAFAKVGPSFANWASIIFGFVAALSFLMHLKKGRLVDRQTSSDSIRSLSWKEFELLISEAFRRQGYFVEENWGGPDGGVDLVLRKDGKKTFVQCKSWRSSSVGVTVIRELFGVVTAEGADKGIVVCSGRFTQEAVQFANKADIQLLGERELNTLLRSVQKIAQIRPVVSTPSCPRCGTEMVQRVAKRGANAGDNFWGCARYPRCRGTLG